MFKIQYRPCTFRHLRDLEVVPHPRKVPVLSSTLGSWKWSPTPKMLSTINKNQTKQRNPKSETTPKTKTRPVFYNEVSLFFKENEMVLWSIRTFWYKGSAENKENGKFEKKLYLKNCSPGSKADFSEKSKFGIWKLILSRYDIILNI